MSKKEERDWPALYIDYQESLKRNPALTLASWTNVNSLSYTYCSKQFAEISRLQTAELGSMLAPKAMKRLGTLIDAKDGNLATKAATSVLDRTGYSPQSVAISINNSATANMQSNLVIPPMFSNASNANEIKELLGVEDERKD